MAMLSGGAALRESVTIDEVPHIGAGLSYVQKLDLRLNEVRKLLEERQISLELTEPARQLILAAGSDAAYGARPLKRALQRLIQDPLAIKILNGDVLHGAHMRIDVDRNSNQLRFEPMGREAMA